MLGVIGGSGFYEIDGVEMTETLSVTTPFGEPSATIKIVSCEGQKAAFLPRHGERHQYLPSEINYRANIWALKSVGVRQIISVSAVGSLRMEIKPGDFAVPAQYFDHTRGLRERTFFGNGLVAHISTAKPACPTLSKALADAAQKTGVTLHINKTYACVEGPRLGTRAESFFLRDVAGADLVGMTNVPEVFLAREAQICYAALAIATDYDCWLDDPDHHVTVEMVIQQFGDSVGRAKEIVRQVMAAPPQTNEKYRRALDSAILTPPSMLSEEHKNLLSVLQS